MLTPIARIQPLPNSRDEKQNAPTTMIANAVLATAQTLKFHMDIFLYTLEYVT